MRILALETSTRAASIAVLRGETLLEQAMLDPHKRTAQALTPAIAAVLDAAGWRPREFELVAVTVGPGSFTGLRIGVTTAKTLAYAAGCEVMGVDALEVTAWQVPRDIDHVWAVADAQRQQVCCGTFARNECGQMQARGPWQVIDNDRWLAGLGSADAVTGPGLQPLLGRIPAGVTVVDRELWTPTAPAVGRLAYRQFQSGRRDDVWRLVPRYSRKSAAEEKWEKRR